MISITCRKLWSRGHPHTFRLARPLRFHSSQTLPVMPCTLTWHTPGHTRPAGQGRSYTAWLDMLDLARITAGNVLPTPIF